jgi:hypothetical protein
MEDFRASNYYALALKYFEPIFKVGSYAMISLSLENMRYFNEGGHHIGTLPPSTTL